MLRYITEHNGIMVEVHTDRSGMERDPRLLREHDVKGVLVQTPRGSVDAPILVGAYGDQYRLQWRVVASWIADDHWVHMLAGTMPGVPAEYRCIRRGGYHERAREQYWKKREAELAQDRERARLANEEVQALLAMTPVELWAKLRPTHRECGRVQSLRRSHHALHTMAKRVLSHDALALGVHDFTSIAWQIKKACALGAWRGVE